MIEVYNIEQADKWDEIVHSFKEYDVYWLSGYVKAFQIHGDGDPFLIFYDDGVTRGINVVMNRDVAKDVHFKGKIQEGRYFDFASPYGYGGWIIEGNDTRRLFAEYEKWANASNIVSEFVRFHPVISNHSKCVNSYKIIPLGEVVTMDLTTSDIVWENISSKNRNVIRKAVKNNVKVYNGRFPEIYEKFIEIYNATMDKDSADKYYYFEHEFFQSVLEDLPENAQIFYAVKENEIIAASIILCANKMLNYHLSGSRQEYSSLAATNLILYRAALWGCENGFKSLYLGGGVGSGEDSLFKFKRSFYRGNLRRFFIGKKVFDIDIYQYLTMIRMKEIQNFNFFPTYRG